MSQATDGKLETVDQMRAAEILGVKAKTLEGWRWKKEGPAYMKIGRLVRYRLSDLAEFLDRQTVTTRG